MKKWIGSIIIIAMIGWTIFDFLKTNKTVEDREDVGSEIKERGLEIGDQAPDFKLLNLEGEKVSLSDYRGTPVLLNFWATWCPPCRSEMPDMESFYQSHDVTVLAVNLMSGERKESDVVNFSKDYELTFPIVLDQMGSVSELYKVHAVPTSYMIDENGKISGKVSGAISKDMMEKMLYEAQ